MRLSSWFALLSAAPMLAAASQPLTLQPSSQWVVEYGDDSCRLIRMFGEGPDQTKLVFESIAPGDMTMLVAGKPVSAPMDALNVGTRFLPLQSKPYYGVPAKSENHEPAAFWASVPLKFGAGRT